MINIKFAKLTPTAKIPSFGKDDPSNAAVDFYADISEPIMIEPNSSVKIPTGVAWDPPNLLYSTHSGPSLTWKPYLKIYSRSGLGVTQSIECSNAGVIDSGYRGEIIIKLYNLSPERRKINPGDRVGQGVIYLVPEVSIVEVDATDMTSSVRGSDGFGSSGQ